MEQQTAVEWLFEQIPFEWSSSKAAFEALQQAKEMEKEQIINAFDIGSQDENRIGKEYYDDLYSL